MEDFLIKSIAGASFITGLLWPYIYTFIDYHIERIVMKGKISRMHTILYDNNIEYPAEYENKELYLNELGQLYREHKANNLLHSAIMSIKPVPLITYLLENRNLIKSIICSMVLMNDSDRFRLINVVESYAKKLSKTINLDIETVVDINKIIDLCDGLTSYDLDDSIYEPQTIDADDSDFLYYYTFSNITNILNECALRLPEVAR